MQEAGSFGRIRLGLPPPLGSSSASLPCGLSRRACYGAWVPPWLSWLIAAVIAAAIWMIGIASLRAFSPKPGSREPGSPQGVEDVEDLEVSFVCGECGTELRVTRLGELQVPRHCGERMQVVRGPGHA